MFTFKATIDGHNVEIPVELFNDLALIPSSPYLESYWANNHTESESFDMITDNGWLWVVNKSDVGAQVLQIVPGETRVVDAAIPADLYEKFMDLIPRADKCNV